MTTLPTNPPAVLTAAPLDAVALLERQVEVLQTAVQSALRQHLFQNHGRLMTPRHLPAASQEIVQSYLHFLRSADLEHLKATIGNLATQGLGHLSALVVTDTLYNSSHHLWQEASLLAAEAIASLESYRHYFLYYYMQVREQITVTARENFYQNVEAALERQVRQERDLRQELEAQRSQIARERGLLVSLRDSIPDLIFYKDIDGAYLGCNDAFAEFSGRSEADLIGKTDFDMFPHEKVAFFHEQDAEILAEGRPRQSEEWVHYPDGRRVLLNTLKTPFYDANRNLLGLIGISRDITATYEFQQELLRLGYVVEQSLDGTAVADLDGTIQFINPAWAAMHGYTQDELLGQHLGIFHTAEQLTVEVEPANQQAIASGQPQRAEIGHVRKDGSIFPTLMTIGLLKDNDGAVIGLVASAQDITEQKKAEASLAKRVRELQAVAEVGTAVAATLDPDTLLQEVVNLTQSRFNLYHAHIYLLDETRSRLNLTAGAGEVGQKMVAQGWQIPLNQERSLVARVARAQRGAIVNDVRAEPDFLPNPLLPDTRAELAVPIIAGEELLGVLDVQADTTGYFSDEDVLIQTTLATQIGVAMQNARLFAQSEATRQELSHLTRRLTREGWQTYLTRQQQPEVRFSVGRSPHNGQAFTQSLVVQGEQIGQLALAEPQNFSDEAAEIMTAVAERLSSHIENLRLTEQTQAALAETADQAERLTLLNRIAQVISQTLERDEMLEAVYQQIRRVFDTDTFHIGLYDAASNTIHYPILYERSERQAAATLPLYPESNSYQVLQTGEALLRHLTPEEVARIKAEKPHILFGETEEVTASLLFAPLRVGQRTRGVISTQSYNFNAYNQEDLQLLNGIAGYVAVALENADLFTRTKQRATILQTLAEIETALSLAQSEDDILEALIAHLPQGNLLTASLSYFDQATEAALDGDTPISLASLWASGAFVPDIARQYQDIPLNEFSTATLWQENVYTPTLVTDIRADSRATPRMLEEAAQQGGWRSMVQLPLRSGGRWQGLIALNWIEPQTFGEDEEFLFNRLMEPVAAVVAGRRAQLAQQEALSETEMLYMAGAALNAAQTYEEILAVIRQYTIADRAQSVSLSLFDRVWATDQMPDWVEVAAYYTRRTGVNVPTRFPLHYFPSATTLLKADSPTVIEDIDDPSLAVDANTRALYGQQFAAKAVIFAPLVVAGQWIGYINVLYDTTRHFSDADIRRLTALSTQAAVAIQNVGSVAETRERAEELGVLNEMSRALATILDPGEIVESIYRFTSQLLDTTNFYIALYDEPSNEISFPYAVEDGERVRWPSRLFGEGMTEYLLRSGQPLLVESNLQGWIEQQEGLASIGSEANSWLGVPMVSGRQTIGVIAVQSGNDHQFNTNHLNLLSAVGSQTTIALQNARLFQQTQARAQREQILREITARVRGSADVETIMKTAVQEIGHTLGRKAMIYLGDEHGA